MHAYFKTLSIFLFLSWSFVSALEYEMNYMPGVPQNMDIPAIQQLVDEALDHEISQHPYAFGRINIYDDHFVVYLNRADIYLFTCFRLQMEKSRLVDISTNYVEPDPDPDYCATCPDETVQTVFSAITQFQSAIQGAENAHASAEKAGLVSVCLIGREESTQNIKDYLSCPNLMAWGRIGHGNTSGISLGSGSFNTGTLNQVGDGMKGRSFVFNSCQCHKPPFEPAMIDAGVKYYSGGDINLAVGPSEKVFANFWERAMVEAQDMNQAMKDAMQEEGYRGFGISGDESGPPWFFISDPYIMVSVPNGSEEWEQGKTEIIKWGDNIDGNVKIELLKGSTLVETIAASVTSSGTHEWAIPADFDLGTDYKIKITSIDSASLTDESDANFSITPEYIISQYPHKVDFDALTSGSTILTKKWEQIGTDDFDWLVLKGPPPSKEYGTTGPDNDHSGSGNYIYLEASNPNNPSKKADITSPKFNLSVCQSPVLTFFYHMFSDSQHMGSLHLDIIVDGKEHKDVVSLTNSDYGDKWNEQKVDLTKYKGDRVIFRFRGITGQSYASDICIDDFTVESGGTSVMPVSNKLLSLVGMLYSGSSLHYVIPENGNTKVNLAIYNSQGRLVKTLVNGMVNTRFNSVPVNYLAKGLYIAKLETENIKKTYNFMITR